MFIRSFSAIYSEDWCVVAIMDGPRLVELLCAEDPLSFGDVDARQAAIFAAYGSTGSWVPDDEPV